MLFVGSRGQGPWLQCVSAASREDCIRRSDVAAADGMVVGKIHLSCGRACVLSNGLCLGRDAGGFADSREDAFIACVRSDIPV